MLFLEGSQCWFLGSPSYPLLLEPSLFVSADDMRVIWGNDDKDGSFELPSGKRGGWPCSRGELGCKGASKECSAGEVGFDGVRL